MSPCSRTVRKPNDRTTASSPTTPVPSDRPTVSNPGNTSRIATLRQRHYSPTKRRSDQCEHQLSAPTPTSRPAALPTHGAFTSGVHDAMLDGALAAATTARDQGRVAILQAVDNRTVRDLNARARADGILAGTIARDGVTLHDGESRRRGRWCRPG